MPPQEPPPAVEARLAELRAAQVELLANIKATLPELEGLHRHLVQNWVGEEFLYRFYHQSFKVFTMQHHTEEIVAALAALTPTNGSMNEWFSLVIDQGTGIEFETRMNRDWLTFARPVLEAHQHARHFLDLVVGYGRILDEPPVVLPAGWAAVLYLYNIR